MTSPGHTPDELVSHYRIVRKLGAGGMGEVYLAEDTQLGRPVAIKFLTETDDDPDAHKRLLREARAAAALDHPNICAVYEVSAHTDPPFIVMQYVEGETLAARLRRGPLAYAEALRMALEIADALGAAHLQGIVHRDVKPQNIVLTQGGHAKLLDFGIARRRPTDVSVGSQPTQTVTHVGIVGTPAYMAPEQIHAAAVDGRTDLFALGAVLYECLTGVAAFSGRSAVEVFAAILNSNPPPPSTLVPALPPAADEICRRLLQKNPDDRFESAADVVTALREIGGQTHRSVRLRRTVSPFGRRTFLLITAVLAVSVLATLSVVRKRPLSLDPAPAAAEWYERGLTALQEGSYFQAMRALERAVALDRSYPFGWARLAEAQLELDQEERAAESVLRAVRLVDDRSRLPDVDRLAFEATMGMVNRDYADAQDAYTALLGRRPESDTVRLDLGRAYEAGEAIDKAIEQYREATRLNPSNPAPFLRLGILHGRGDDVDSALEAFGRAEDLYKAASNVEGTAAVSLQRGIVLSRLGDRSAEARAALEHAAKLAESVGSTYLTATALFRLSSLAGTQGQYQEAEQLALRALEIGKGLDSLTAFGLVDLGNVFVYSQQYDRAARYFEQALQLAGAARARRAEARARLAMASLQMARGHVGDATRNAKAALAYYERAGFRGLRVLALTLLAQGQVRAGDLESAHRSYEDLLDLARSRNVPRQLAEQHNQLAGVLLLRERYEDALQHCDAALALFRKMETPYDIVHAGLARADILGRLGRFQDAGRQLDSLPDGGSEQTEELQRLRQLRRATLALLSGQIAQARGLAQDGFEAAGGDAADELNVEFGLILALAQARSGRADAGWETLQSAGTAIADLANEVLAARLSLARAETLLRLGRAPDALSLAGALGDRFHEDGRFESAWLSYSVAARAAALRGDADQEGAWSARARAARTAFEETLTSAARVTVRERKDLLLAIH